MLLPVHAPQPDTKASVEINKTEGDVRINLTQVWKIFVHQCMRHFALWTRHSKLATISHKSFILNLIIQWSPMYIVSCNNHIAIKTARSLILISSFFSNCSPNFLILSALPCEILIVMSLKINTKPKNSNLWLDRNLDSSMLIMKPNWSNVDATDWSSSVNFPFEFASTRQSLK